jgi:excisionase family DNA binding protein
VNKEIATPRLYTRIAAAHALSVSPRTIDRMIADKTLSTRKIGRRVLIPAAAYTPVSSEMAAAA